MQAFATSFEGPILIIGQTHAMMNVGDANATAGHSADYPATADIVADDSRTPRYLREWISAPCGRILCKLIHRYNDK